MPVEPADVVAGYRLILGREPEDAAVVREKQALPDRAALRTVLMESDEFRLTLPGLLEDDRIAATRIQATALYRAMLGRSPEPEALEAIGRERISAARLAGRIADSAEYRDRQQMQAALAQLRAVPRRARDGAPRILLFGAYGNGNLGDAAQAEAMARLAARALGPVRCDATSWLDAAPYDARDAGIRAPNVIVDGEKLAEFDAVLFGGGGLFGPQHFPLDRADWARWFCGLGIPFGFVGIGTSDGTTLCDEVRPAADALFRQAAFVSTRDAVNDWSTRAIAAFRPDWVEMPDPVLLAGLLDGQGAPRGGGGGTLLIVKVPVDAAEAAVLDRLAAHAQAHAGTTRIAVLEPARDRDIAGRFPMAPAAPGSMAALVALCAQAGRVVSMRLHGAVAGVLAGTPSVAGPAPKARALMRDLGLAGHGFADVAGLDAALAAPPGLPPDAALQRLRRIGEDGLRRLAAALRAAGLATPA